MNRRLHGNSTTRLHKNEELSIGEKMAHSNRKKLSLTLLAVEILLFLSALVTAFLGEKQLWNGFTAVCILSLVLYSVLRFVKVYPELKEFIVKEDFAARIASAAGEYGVRDYFNMQDSKEQASRNKCTEEEIQTGIEIVWGQRTLHWQSMTAER